MPVLCREKRGEKAISRRRAMRLAYTAVRGPLLPVDDPCGMHIFFQTGPRGAAGLGSPGADAPRHAPAGSAEWGLPACRSYERTELIELGPGAPWHHGAARGAHRRQAQAGRRPAPRGGLAAGPRQSPVYVVIDASAWTARQRHTAPRHAAREARPRTLLVRSEEDVQRQALGHAHKVSAYQAA